MAQPFEDFIQSHQFTFFIGKEGKSIVVHAAAIAATSQQLNALINGGMEESEKRCARIEDVEVDDFIRFCEYAYRGDYTVPPCKIQQSHGDEVSGIATSSDMVKKRKKKTNWAQAGLFDEQYPQESPTVDFEAPSEPPADFDAPSEPPSKARPASRTPLRTQFNSRNYLSDKGPKAIILKQFEPIPNKTADQDFRPVFLAHAQLYSFAHVRLIAPLKELTLHKLHKTLLDFKLYAERVGDIIELARYVYSNPDLPGRNNDASLDDLRKLVVDYIVCEIDTIGESDTFAQYIEEGGEFVGDFWRLAKKYMA